MKAIVCNQYGGPEVLKLQEDFPKPVPKANEVLVKIVASSANAGDWHVMRADPWIMRLMFGMTKPKCKILGSDIAGRVEAVGAKVTQFKVGDEVFGDVSDAGFRAFSEYISIKETVIAHKPTSLSFEDAAALPVASVTALQALRDCGKVQEGQKVLINGASGGVGHFAVQIAKALGAGEVTGVTSTKNIELVTSLGADKVIDYKKEDFTKNNEKYDLIIDAAGFRKADFDDSLTKDGKYVFVGGSTEQLGHVMWKSMMGSKKTVMMMASPGQKDLLIVKQLAEDGKLRPAVDRRYSFDEVPDAIRYLEEGHSRGKIVINIQADA